MSWPHNVKQWTGLHVAISLLHSGNDQQCVRQHALMDMTCVRSVTEFLCYLKLKKN